VPYLNGRRMRLEGGLVSGVRSGHKCPFQAGACVRSYEWSAMIKYSEKGDSVTFKVRVVPRASRSEVVGEHDGALRVRLAAPPVDGAANEELVRLLARSLGVSRTAIEIKSGLAAKLKVVRVSGLGPSALADLLGVNPPRSD
jgi:uncharacterized protein